MWPKLLLDDSIWMLQSSLRHQGGDTDVTIVDLSILDDLESTRKHPSCQFLVA